ncbi:MAG: YggS family pyridoxal phosphate-dependent enzyme [Actinomycetes bacterium]
MTEVTLAQRLEAVKDRINVAATKARRDVAEIQLVIVTKNNAADLPLTLLELGESNFGENRDQEASAKALIVSEHKPGLATWHFVGQLQSNKVRSMLQYTSVLHSLDRTSLLTEINKQLAKTPAAKLEAFIELNLTEDPNRGGLDPNGLEAFAELVLTNSQIQLQGVMGVVGLGVEPSVDFERIAKASQVLRELAPEAKFISAGMSGDFEEAIGFGATHLRIGTAITGNR